MTIGNSLRTALRGLRVNKSRSILTVLGIVVGITAVVLVVSIGGGAEKLILGQIGGLGSDIIVVRPGQEPKGPSDIGETLFSDSLKVRDIEALQRRGNVPGLKDIMPAVIVTGSASYQGETYKPMTLGASAELMADVFNAELQNGVFFNGYDIAAKSSVVVIGSKTKNELFGDSDAVGEYIKIKDRKFRVVGVLEPKGQVSFFNFDELALIPYSTAQTYLLGINHFHEVIVRAASADIVGEVVEDIERTLRQNHGIEDFSKDDFFVVTQEGLIDQVKTIISALTAFLSSMMAISLIVGGIGVMNIMFVSVSERTREIGLRKALGATGKDILSQFLLEAVVLTLIGGMIGIVLGFSLSFAASVVLSRVFALDWTFSFSIAAFLIGLGVSAFVGLVFGVYPARHASQKSPIEALRHE